MESEFQVCEPHRSAGMTIETPISKLLGLNPRGAQLFLFLIIFFNMFLGKTLTLDLRACSESLASAPLHVFCKAGLMPLR
jgi:hypothetical protein